MLTTRATSKLVHRESPGIQSDVVDQEQQPWADSNKREQKLVMYISTV